MKRGVVLSSLGSALLPAVGCSYDPVESRCPPVDVAAAEQWINQKPFVDGSQAITSSRALVAVSNREALVVYTSPAVVEDGKGILSAAMLGANGEVLENEDGTHGARAIAATDNDLAVVGGAALALDADSEYVGLVYGSRDVDSLQGRILFRTLERDGRESPWGQLALTDVTAPEELYRPALLALPEDIFVAAWARWTDPAAGRVDPIQITAIEGRTVWKTPLTLSRDGTVSEVAMAFVAASNLVVLATKERDHLSGSRRLQLSLLDRQTFNEQNRVLVDEWSESEQRVGLDLANMGDDLVVGWIAETESEPGQPRIHLRTVEFEDGEARLRGKAAVRVSDGELSATSLSLAAIDDARVLATWTAEQPATRTAHVEVVLLGADGDAKPMRALGHEGCQLTGVTLPVDGAGGLPFGRVAAVRVGDAVQVVYDKTTEGSDNDESGSSVWGVLLPLQDLVPVD